MIKIIDLDINEALSADTKVEAVALVEMPAIETEFIYFNNQNFQEPTVRVTKEISDIACKARKYKQENPNTTCGTNVGWTRSSQLCDQKPISLDTVKRMYSYLSRHKVDLVSSKSYEDGCGKLMYDAWGGEPALTWSKRILQQYKEFDYDITALPDYVGYDTGNTLVKDVAFIEKRADETKDDYISRCIAYHIDKGYPQDQAAAICYNQADEAFDCGCFEEMEDDPCWPGYEMVGQKEKDGKLVPNCVPIENSVDFNVVGYIQGIPYFINIDDAVLYGKEEYNCGGYHTHELEDGTVVYMPCETHAQINQEYSAEEIEVKKHLEFLKQTDTQAFEAIRDEMLRGYTQQDIISMNHKNPVTYFQYFPIANNESGDSRDFCMSIENRFFRRLQIDMLRDYNMEFGHNGQGYSKWLFKGGPQCVHGWRRFLAQEAVLADLGMVEGRPGTAPKQMPGAGYYPGTPRYEANLSSVCTECDDITKQEKEKYKKATFKSDKEKRMLYSPLMIPNILIPRLDNGEKYFVRFTKEAIERIQRKFMIEQRLRDTNLEHNGDDTFKDMVMVESWLVNGESDKAFTLGYSQKEIPTGTWMVGYKVLDTPEGDNIWNNYIKTGKVKGLSAEGAFLMNFSRIKTDEYLLEEIINILNKINQK